MKPEKFKELWLGFGYPWEFFNFPFLRITEISVQKWLSGRGEVPREVVAELLKMRQVFFEELRKNINFIESQNIQNKALISYEDSISFQLKEPENYEKFFYSSQFYNKCLLHFIKPKLEKMGYTISIIVFRTVTSIEKMKLEGNEEVFTLEKIFPKEELTDFSNSDIREAEITHLRNRHSLHKLYLSKCSKISKPDIELDKLLQEEIEQKIVRHHWLKENSLESSANDSNFYTLTPGEKLNMMLDEAGSGGYLPRMSDQKSPSIELPTHASLPTGSSEKINALRDRIRSLATTATTDK